MMRLCSFYVKEADIPRGIISYSFSDETAIYHGKKTTMPIKNILEGKIEAFKIDL